MNVPVVLVGNKADADAARQVSRQTVEETKLKLMNNCPYIETSAKYNVNVARLFLELLQQARTLDSTSTPEMRRRHKLARRLSSFGSLPNISLIRRKSSGSQKAGKTGGNDNKANDEANGTAGDVNDAAVNNSVNDAVNGNGRRQLSGLGRNRFHRLNTSSMTGSFDNVTTDIHCEIKRHIINGMDTISLSDGSKTPPDQKCTIL